MINNPYYLQKESPTMGIVQFIARALMIMIIAAALVLAAERFQEAVDAYQAQEQAKDQSANFSNSK